MAMKKMRQVIRFLQSQRLHLLRGVTLVVVFTALSLFVANLIVKLEIAQTVCTLEAFCFDEQLTQSEVDELMDVGLSLPFYASLLFLLGLVQGLIYIIVGLVVFWKINGDIWGLFVTTSLICFGVMIDAETLLVVSPFWKIPGSFIDFFASSAIVLFYLFPNGRFVPKWTKLLSIIWIILSIGRLFLPGTLLDPQSWPWWLNTPIWISFFISVLYSQIIRYKKHSSRTERQQIKWFIFGLVCLVAGVVTAGLFSQVVASSHVVVHILQAVSLTFLSLSIPISIGISILRYRLWDIDILIRRAIVYGTLTVVIIAVYVIIVSGIGSFFRTRVNLLLSTVATALVAVLIQPLSTRLTQSVNRLLYGERDDPYTVLSKLNKQLETTLKPEEILPAVVETVAQTLKLPYVAVSLFEGEHIYIEASIGKPVKDPLVLQLSYPSSEPLGQLILGRRDRTEDFNPSERVLLTNLSRQVGMAAYNVKINRELQVSRERLVTTREEERRRLRRDLHDGLGPFLAGLVMKLEATTNLVTTKPTSVPPLLQQMKEDLQNSIKDIRLLVQGLRPPALDELGLIGAIQESSEQVAYRGIHVTVHCQEFHDLSAAVEVAIYRIVQEALMNVVHHSGATVCQVELTFKDGIQLTVDDNGCGMETSQNRGGVGLKSMRERAEELGGHITIEKAQLGGVRVLAWLPLSQIGGMKDGQNSNNYS